MKRLVLLAAAFTVLVAAAAASAETITPVCTTAQNTSPCSAGWYTTPVDQLSWAWTAGGTPSNCDQLSFLADAVATVSCTVSWPDGFVGMQPYTIHVETSSPTATVTPSRPPDSGGWYNHPLTATVAATAFSGIASCTSPTYAGPNSATATLSATCTDNAGKTVTVASAPFAYDVTPPSLTAAATTGDRTVQLSWQTSGDLAPAASVTVTRSPGGETVYSGNATGYTDTGVSDGVTYTYTITAKDVAGNASTQTVVATPAARLLQPVANANVLKTAPPTLTWTPIRGASYYNVQLYAFGGKVLSMWPSRAKLQLPRKWSFDGHRYRLKPGRYRWFVWPGFGKRSAGRYGHRIGTGSFVVR
jgi:hypothetical protein